MTDNGIIRIKTLRTFGQDETVSARPNSLRMIAPFSMKGLIRKVPITEITGIVATIEASPGQTRGITMRVSTGIAETNDPCIPKVVKEITRIPWSGCRTGTTPPPQEGSMILRGRGPISINPGVPAGRIMITDLMDIDHNESVNPWVLTAQG